MNTFALTDHVIEESFPSTTFHNQLGTLNTLFCGLATLANQVENLQKIARTSQDGEVVMGFYSDLESSFNLPRGSNELLPCFYHWFGVTIVNFARSVGLMRGIQNGELASPPHLTRASRIQVKNYCNSYLHSVSEIAAAVVWRNKVFAHFSNTDPHEQDSESLLEQVSFYPMSYVDGLFKVGSWTIYKNIDISAALPPPTLPAWSLTQMYEQFSKRYSFATLSD